MGCRHFSSPTLIDCTFLGNSAQNGGGMQCCDESSPTLIDCTFSGNSAREGGGMYCYDHVSPTLIDCTLSDNMAVESGGGMVCYWYAAATLTNCTFSSNSANIFGGGMECWDADPMLVNCTFSDNTASAIGGGIYCLHAYPTLERTIIAFSTNGRAIYCAGNSDPTLACCDVYGNAGGDWVGCIADQLGVNGNICEDPLFCDPEGGDFRLQEGSPCGPFSPPNPECDLIGAWAVGCYAPVEDQARSLDTLYLAPSVPNPFGPRTCISYGIPAEMGTPRVILSIHDATGRLLRTLVNAHQPAGIHSVAWDGADETGKPVVGGIYFYQLSAGGEKVTRRMALVK